MFRFLHTTKVIVSTKASDSLGYFVRRSPRSAKIARCTRCSDGRITHTWHSPSVPVPAIFYGHYCESPVKSTHQVGRFSHMNFQNCHIAAIGEKNRYVCPHHNRWRKSLAIFAGYQIRRDRRIKSLGVSPA